MIEEGWRAKSDIPVMKRIVVEIDPAISVSETADETSIIVTGLSSDGTCGRSCNSFKRNACDAALLLRKTAMVGERS
jgi:hypothetical protein